MEGQGQRPGRRVLAPRKITFGVTEPFAVEHLQVNRRKIGATPDVPGVKLAQDVVAIGLRVFVTQTHDKYESANLFFGRNVLQDHTAVGFESLVVLFSHCGAALQQILDS